MSKQITVFTVLVVSLVVFCPTPQTAAPVEPGSTPAQTVTIMQPTNQQPRLTLNSTVVLPEPTITSTEPIVLGAQHSPNSLKTTYASASETKRSGTRAVTIGGASYPVYRYQAVAMPNDPGANQSFVATANLSAAWDIPRGAAPTLLAIIDTGFALQHQEFANRFYTNPGEAGAATSESASLRNCTARGLPLNQSCNLIDDDGDGIVDNEVGATTRQNPSRLNCSDQGRGLAKDCNLIDDDGNGYIDDFRGWDFINNDRSVQAGEVNSTGDGTHHGTYVAGVAAATGNNGVGLAGVDWGTTILPIQALDDDGSGDTVAVANAINYAVARNADVISLSLGSTGNDLLVRQAVRQAVAAGIIVVAAAGNDGCDCMLYPANYPEVLAVGASTSSGQRSGFSSFGANLDILAPGENLYTTDWQAGNQTSAYASGISGTSLATPIVAGLLTRMISQRPTATPAQLIAALTENTNPLGLTAANPRSNLIGFGLVDAAKASRRLVTAYAPTQLYQLARINQYGTASALIYQCEPNVIGTTPVYELTRAGTTAVFTTDVIEAQVAQAQGSTASLFSYSCLSQNHDTPQLVRSLNVYSEFRNLFIK